MSEGTIVITSDELSEHAVLSRKRTETAFRRDFLLRNGTQENEAAVAALNALLSEIVAKLAPIEEKLRQVDLITVVPNRGEIAKITADINRNPRTDLDAALKSRAGPVYELMKRRAALTKVNFERRDEIAKLTVLANTLPRQAGEGLRQIVEEGAGEEVDVSGLPAEKQQELVDLLGRLSRLAFVYSGKLSLDKKKVDGLEYLSWRGEVLRQMQTGQPVWIARDRAGEWEQNEAVIKAVGSKIIAKTHEKQVREFSEDEQAEFDRLQKEYIAAKEKRDGIMPPFLAHRVELPRSGQKARREEIPQLEI